MKRTQILLDEPTYEALRRRAFESGRSLSAVVREILLRSLSRPAPRKGRRLADFTFIGSGNSRQGKLAPVSERHDEALEAALAKRPRR